jgi:thiopeptide-type bacteriocin biosynthesis protein
MTWLATSTSGSGDQEIERYGGVAAIGAAEHVFAADSSLALAVLASVSDRDQRLIIAALSAAAIARPMTDAYQAALAADLLATSS